MRPHGPAPRGGYLVSLEIQELVRRHVLRQYVSVAVGLEHGREHYAVEHYVVLAYEMHELGVGRFPPPLPVVGQQFLSIRDVSYRGVEPYIQHLALGTLYGHGHTPVQVAGHGPGLKAAVQPALDLSVHVAPPLLVAVEYPFAQPGLVVLERQIPVGRLLLYRLGAAELALGVDEFLGAERASALLALVAVGSLRAAPGTGPDYVAVGKEGPGLGIVVLLALARDELALVIQLPEELGGVLLVHLGSRPAVDVEIYPESLERRLDYAVIPVDYVLRRAVLLARLDRDRDSVLVRAADIQHILALQAEVSDIYVGRDIYAGQMSYMHGAVGIRQRAGNECPFESLVHYCLNCVFLSSYHLSYTLAGRL